jgi:hypothetical protein
MKCKYKDVTNYWHEKISVYLKTVADTNMTQIESGKRTR